MINQNTTEKELTQIMNTATLLTRLPIPQREHIEHMIEGAIILGSLNLAPPVNNTHNIVTHERS